MEADRAAFTVYQSDPRYRALYDFAPGAARSDQLFDQFLVWQDEVPRSNLQLGIFDRSTDRLLGCGGLRKAGEHEAEFGLELAPAEWGRYRLAIDAIEGFLEFGFATLALDRIIGNTASGNRRVAKLARYFGGTLIAERDGPPWMVERGWHEVDWSITRDAWEARRHRR